MDDDLDAGISLNLSAFSKGDKESCNTKRTITGNRGQRIKARKSIKRQKQFALRREGEHGESGNKPKPVSSSQSNGAEEIQDKKEGVYKKKPQSGDVVSSLFRHNPDIPTVKSGSVKPVKERLFASDSFSDVPLHPYMISNLEKLGFSKMTAVQFETIPRLVAGTDLMVKSQTGSGKTMAYAIPIVEDLCRRSPKLTRGDGCLAVVLVPTRELALQSYDVFLKLLKPFTWIVPGCVMGGEKRKAEKARLRKGINILVATPGRLLDHMEKTQNLGLAAVKWLVLDEADRLLDMGFEAKVAEIIQMIDQHASHRQTVLLSATLTEGVEKLAGVALKNPERVAIDQNSTVASTTSTSGRKDDKTDSTIAKNSVGTGESTESDEKFALPESLKQYFVITPCKLRLVVLLTLILSKCRKGNHMKMIVFISTQDGVEFLYRLLHYLTTKQTGSQSDDSDNQSESEDDSTENGKRTTSLDVYRLHGDMSQKDRTSTFHRYCEVKSGVLLCTDVAARGLHLPAVHWVVQYSCAGGVTDYVHRVGRTARAGSVGNTLMFLLPSETEFLAHLNQRNISTVEMKVGEVLRDVMKLIPDLPGMQDTQRQAPHTVEEAATYLQNCCELFVKQKPDELALAKTAYQSYIRAYATYPHHLKSIFHIRHLHLGHVAKTFGLREPPSTIGNIPGVDHSTLHRKRKHEKGEDKRGNSKRKRVRQPSEYQGPLVFKQTGKKYRQKLKKKNKAKK